MTEPFGKNTKLYTIKNDFLKVKISDYGATIVNLFVNDRDIVLGYPSRDFYETTTAYLGATVGRYANRIADGEFVLNNKKYTLAKNDGYNHLHGGNIGFNRKIWNVKYYSQNSICLSLQSPDKEEGYPGNLYIEVTFTLINKQFIIDYYAVCDEDTTINLTNHSYFNLDGDCIENTLLQINADYVNNTDEGLIPVSKSSVESTPFDFRVPKKIGKDIHADDKQLKIQNGYDCNYFINGFYAAKAYSEKSGISMSVYTDMPCIQLYTGNFLNGTEPGKDGNPINFRTGFCMETQFAPNSPNSADFGGCLLKKNEEYKHKTVFQING
ncbi:MAG: galactose-1-epimerase [Clostridiales bacterium]|nr:MAG: galactose-1-epimerase [Clostridiales bacterium]